jgi:hypothetical protein
MSGSMSWCDRQLAVAGFRAFVDITAPGPGGRGRLRLGVYRFSPLEPADSQANIDTVKARSTRPGRRSAADLDSRSTGRSILGASGGGSRLRVAVLLTDGVSTPRHEPDDKAANARSVHTVALGTDRHGCSSRSRPARAQHSLNNPANCRPHASSRATSSAAADTDGDGLTDCVERNGMFIADLDHLPVRRHGLRGRVVSRPTPKGRHRRRRHPGRTGGGRARPRVQPGARLDLRLPRQAGLTTYTLVSDPTKKDTDGDGYDDGTNRHGMNPLVGSQRAGIEGLDLPAFTCSSPRATRRSPPWRRLSGSGQSHRGDRLQREPGPLRRRPPTASDPTRSATSPSNAKRQQLAHLRLRRGRLRLDSRRCGTSSRRRVKQGVFTGRQPRPDLPQGRSRSSALPGTPTRSTASTRRQAEVQRHEPGSPTRPARSGHDRISARLWKSGDGGADRGCPRRPQRQSRRVHRRPDRGGGAGQGDARR